MIRSELVQKLCSDFPDLTQREVESVVCALFDSITDQLAKGGRVELRGFGAFSTRQRDARIGRNPRTGEAVDVDAKRVPYFKPGKEMRERLNLNGKSAPNSRCAQPDRWRQLAAVMIAPMRTWRNGRRWRLKIFCPYGRAGSSPAVRTSLIRAGGMTTASAELNCRDSPTEKMLSNRGLIRGVVGSMSSRKSASRDWSQLARQCAGGTCWSSPSSSPRSSC